MLEAIRDNAKRKRLHQGERLFTATPVGKSTRKIGHLSNPSSVVFLVELNP